MIENKKDNIKHCCENCKYLFMYGEPLGTQIRGMKILKYCKLLKIQLENSEKTICNKFDIPVKSKDKIKEIKEKYNFRIIE